MKASMETSMKALRRNQISFYSKIVLELLLKFEIVKIGTGSDDGVLQELFFKTVSILL